MTDTSASYRRLATPPIAEALIDLRVARRDDIVISDLKDLQNTLGRERFPTLERQVAFTVSFKDELDSSQSAQEVGCLMRSANKTEVLQAQLQGFTFSRLGNYESWDNLITAARSCWDAYLHVARPLSVLRLGVRYVNRIVLPSTLNDINDWLPSFPAIPAGLPQMIDEALYRAVIPLPDIGATAIVMQQLALPMGSVDVPEPASITLDVDVSMAVVMTPEDPKLWDHFEQLRDVKNRFFFSYISKDAQEAMSRG